MTALGFGDWLRERRAELRLSQQEAAKRAGLTRAMWAKLEANEHGTRKHNIPRIAIAMEVESAEVYARAGYAPPTEADATDSEMQLARELHSILRRVPGSQRNRVYRSITDHARSLVSFVSEA